MGFLYIIKRKALTKIGVTVDIQRRMNELKPDTVCQIVRLPRERELEKKLHRLFADKRLHGSEYFFLNWAERRKACSLARRAGQTVRFPHQAPAKTRWTSPRVALEICGFALAAGVAAVLITQPRPNGQPREAPVSFAALTKSFVSV
ncbi:MAG: GIY-YIG nuclease family protein [Synechococcus sp. SB0662_bin_45]|uniref:GIY-YIG nuclease family protein n=1 Tax=Synechococcus sp. SB0676_bin_10 TaxID=2604869 RepID=A0A6B1F672_9SYNE|nr:GIY-YIG nuclease family protein [Cyanobacteria bacterium MAG IRC3_bin_20]MCY3654880.1 GIY-YIG nuclease family protein [Cyanobacteria bacterium MAG IRC1_bin_28]MDE0647128.1 GIY-YIG nuclease family protein [Cyanobacteria bacterium MAG IRC4_bin_6]MXW12020.1 GIY-YIG nuclease family protein [Synechococcus sp. SB0668_bin_13]MXX08508.1 GIY-YIG nuclease family protein [Synechococcus sp. SB0667_bin_8]MYE21565.1 GIY-YIG nuclease family protein [Synechococcus sp. SB0662_bin_45]MYG38481.1 GIY-YIG nucl